jgi:hypothetical protein
LGCILPKEDAVAPREVISEIFSSQAWSSVVLSEARETLSSEGVVIQEYVTTYIGRLLQLLPVNVHSGMLVFFGLLTGLETLMTLTAAAAASQTVFVAESFVTQSQPQQQGGRGGRGKREQSGDTITQLMLLTEESMKTAANREHSDVLAVVGAVLQFREFLQAEATATGDAPSEAAQLAWCAKRKISWDRLVAVMDLDTHIKYELSGFLPFRDIQNPTFVLKQLHDNAKAVKAMICAAFAGQAMSVENTVVRHQMRETGHGVFTPLRAIPDLNNPSCFRWTNGDIVVPCFVSLRFSHLLGGYSTAVPGFKHFYLSLLLFAYRLQYGAFKDGEEIFYRFGITYLGQTRYLELDQATATAVLDFRARLSTICGALRQRFARKDMTLDAFDTEVLAPAGQAPLLAQQQQTLQLVQQFFFGAAFDTLKLEEVAELGGDDAAKEDLDQTSLMSFA